MVVALQCVSVAANAHANHAHAHERGRDHIAQSGGSLAKLTNIEAQPTRALLQGVDAVARSFWENQGDSQPAPVSDGAMCACCGCGTMCCGFMPLADPVSLAPVVQLRRLHLRSLIPVRGIVPEGLRKPPRTIV